MGDPLCGVWGEIKKDGKKRETEQEAKGQSHKKKNYRKKRISAVYFLN
jgi:hypothetical protein